LLFFFFFGNLGYRKHLSISPHLFSSSFRWKPIERWNKVSFDWTHSRS
jgi:hypothetical protein